MISSFLITAKLYGICILVLPLHCNYIVCLKFFRLWIILLRQALISKSGTGWVHSVERFTCPIHVVVKIGYQIWYSKLREEESLASSLLNIICYQNLYQIFTTTWTRQQCAEYKFIKNFHLFYNLVLKLAKKIEISASQQSWN